MAHKIFVKGLNACGMRKGNVQQYVDFLIANGHEVVSHPSQSDKILLWTCGFRGDFRDNSVRELKRYLVDYPAELIVVGCLPDIDNDLLTQEFKGRFINWRDDAEQLEELFGDRGVKLEDVPRKLGDEPLTRDVDAFKKQNPGKDIQFIDQFIKMYVAEGCKFECTYCSEILAFPKYHSFPEDQLVEECRRLVEKTGRYEVMLIGDSVGEYGSDMGSSLPNLIWKLCSIHPQVKIALQGYNPAHFIRYYEEMSELIGKGCIRHLQLPIQTASPRLLKLMNRPYSRKDIDRIFTLLNHKKFTEIDTHLIIGFPGETEEDFEETLQFILRHRPKYVLASRYMDNPMMPSYKLPDKVDPEAALRRLNEASLRIKQSGILCNSDNSELSQCRFKTMNRIGGLEV